MEGWGLEDVKKFQGTWTIYKETLCTLHGLPKSWTFKSAVCRRGVGACSTSNHVSRATWMWARRPIAPVSVISINCWIMKHIANSLQITLEKLVYQNYKGAGFIWETVLLLVLGKLDPSFVTTARLNRLLYIKPASVFSLTKGLQLIFEISATYILVTIADNWTLNLEVARVMHDFQRVMSICVWCDCRCVYRYFLQNNGQ